MNRKIKKLALSRETLRKLDDRSLRGIAGGFVPADTDGPCNDTYVAICTYTLDHTCGGVCG